MHRQKHYLDKKNKSHWQYFLFAFSFLLTQRNQRNFYGISNNNVVGICVVVNIINE